LGFVDRMPSSMSLGFPPLTRGVKWLMIATAVVSVGVGTLNAWINHDLAVTLVEHLRFRAADVLGGRVWQLFTYTFLNPEPINLLLALLSLWLLSGQLERRWGTQRFLGFYFTTTAVAALITVAISLASPGLRGFAYFGVWPGVQALVAAYAINYPDQRINLYFVFPIQARYFIHISLGITLLYILLSGSVMPFVLPTLGLVAGIVFAKGTLAGPRHLWLRMRVFWIERRLANRNLRIVKGGDEPPRRKSGSDGFLH
jgi:membrane associated rhomboid family serine protease